MNKFVILLTAMLGTVGCRKELPTHVMLADVTSPTDMVGVWRYNNEKMRQLMKSYGNEYGQWFSMPRPDGFNLSPHEADFIFSTLLRNTWHFGCTATYYLYYDSHTYYVAANWPTTNRFESAQPMVELACRINAMDGTVFNPTSHLWETVGYLYLSYPEVSDRIHIGQSESEVLGLLGRPFERNRKTEMWNDRQDATEALEYWCRNGNFLVYLKGKNVSGATTNVPWIRL